MRDRREGSEKITGAIGVPPPPEAKREVTLPGSERASLEQIERARAARGSYEKELEPLVFKQTPPLPAAPTPPPNPAMPAKLIQPHAASRRPTVVSSAPAPGQVTIGATEQAGILLTDAVAGAQIEEFQAVTIVDGTAVPVVSAVDPPIVDPVVDPIDELPPIEPHQKAGSNTDSPSRGVPHPSGDPGKDVTGGWGHAGEAQYYPLDGSELRVVVDSLLEKLKARILDDLRFTIAITYPRVRARVDITIEGYAEDQDLHIPQVAVPHESTPIDVAKQYGNEIVFVVSAMKEEMTDAGESVTPPNQMRAELGLEIPRKTFVSSPSGRSLVDVRS